MTASAVAATIRLRRESQPDGRDERHDVEGSRERPDRTWRPVRQTTDRIRSRASALYENSLMSYLRSFCRSIRVRDTALRSSRHSPTGDDRRWREVVHG